MVPHAQLSLHNPADMGSISAFITVHFFQLGRRSVPPLTGHGRYVVIVDEGLDLPLPWEAVLVA
jgi:hypothetical protein